LLIIGEGKDFVLYPFNVPGSVNKKAWIGRVWLRSVCLC